MLFIYLQRWIATPQARICALYTLFGLFVLEQLSVIMGHGQVRVAGLQPQDMALAGGVGVLMWTDRKFLGLVTSRWSLVYLGLIGLYTALGILLGNDLGWIRTDLRFFLWPYGGIALTWMLFRARKPLLHMLVLQGILTLMLYLAAKQSHGVHFSETNFVAGQDRLYGLNLFAVGGLMLYFIGLHVSYFSRRSMFALATAGFFIAIFGYYIIYLAATRNLLLAFGMLAVACVPGYVMGMRKGDFTRSVDIAKLALLCLIAVGGLSYVAVKSDDLLVIERFQGGDLMRDASARGRIHEINNVLDDYDLPLLISGSGIGTLFRPYSHYQTNFLHFGVAAVVLKFGLPIGLSLVVLLYIVLPLLLVRAFFWPSSLSPAARNAIYVGVPILMPWLVQLGISGGLTTTDSMGIGLAVGAAYHAARRGLVASESVESTV